MSKSSRRKPTNRLRPPARPANSRPNSSAGSSSAGKSPASPKGASKKVATNSGSPDYTSPLARKIAAASMPALIWLHSRPRWFLLVLIGVLLLAGLLVQGIPGALLLLVLATFLAWLLLLSWPVLQGGGRLGRVLMVAMVAGAALVKVLP